MCRKMLILVVLSGAIAILPIAKAAGSETTLFSDDFESYSVGTFPSAGGWIRIWGAWLSGNYVTDAYSFSPTKSFQLWGRPNWSSVAQKKFSTDAPIIGYEFAICIHSIGTGGPGREEHPGFFRQMGWGNYYAFLRFNHDDGKIKAEDGTVLGDWVPGIWCQVKVVLDRSTNTYTVWIDGELKAEGLSTIHSDTTDLIDALALVSAHPGVKVYYDDVRVFEVSLPILEKEVTSGPETAVIPDDTGYSVDQTATINGPISEIDVVVEVGKSSTTEYDFDITYINLGGPEVLVVDTVPAEWVVTNVAGNPIVDGFSGGPQPDGNGGTGTVEVFPVNRHNSSKSATKIHWRPDPTLASIINVVAETRQSPGKKNIMFAPTSCGVLFLNEDGAEAFEVDPETGEPLRDPQTGEKLPPILVSNSLCLAAVEDCNGDGVIAGDGSGDEDGDGLSDLEEACQLGTNPCNSDTDGDSVPDGNDPDPLDPEVS